MNPRATSFALAAAVAIGGCAARHAGSVDVAARAPASAPTSAPTTAPTSSPATSPRPAATPRLQVHARDYDALWLACRSAARARGFTIAREDYRGGVLTTEPLVSAQFFEPWRRDAITATEIARSSLASIRRTLRFELTRLDDGKYAAAPHVIVERYSAAERRITSAMSYRSAFRKTESTGTREADRGVVLQARYWYRIGNDPALERSLANAIRRRI